MPELPEVETIRLGLQKYLVGHKILDVEVRVPKLFEGSAKQIVDSKVTKVRRFGKGLVIDLDNGHSLAIHIKLTGQLIYRDEKTENLPVSKQKVGTVPSKFTHVIFELDPSAGSRQARLTLEYFKKVLGSSGVAVKPLIMDQKRIGGIGNIYANDALYFAKIDPKRPARSLSSQEVKKLYEGVHKVMEKGMKYGGSSELTYVNVLGQEGEYQRHTLVYGRQGDICERDGGRFKKIFLGGRGTYFCSACQR